MDNSRQVTLSDPRIAKWIYPKTFATTAGNALRELREHGLHPEYPVRFKVALPLIGTRVDVVAFRTGTRKHRYTVDEETATHIVRLGQKHHKTQEGYIPLTVALEGVTVDRKTLLYYIALNRDGDRSTVRILVGQDEKKLDFKRSTAGWLVSKESKDELRASFKGCIPLKEFIYGYTVNLRKGITLGRVGGELLEELKPHIPIGDNDNIYIVYDRRREMYIQRQGVADKYRLHRQKGIYYLKAIPIPHNPQHTLMYRNGTAYFRIPGGFTTVTMSRFSENARCRYLPLDARPAILRAWDGIEIVEREGKLGGHRLRARAARQASPFIEDSGSSYAIVGKSWEKIEFIR